MPAYHTYDVQTDLSYRSCQVKHKILLCAFCQIYIELFVIDFLLFSDEVYRVRRKLCLFHGVRNYWCLLSAFITTMSVQNSSLFASSVVTDVVVVDLPISRPSRREILRPLPRPAQPAHPCYHQTRSLNRFRLVIPQAQSASYRRAL